MRKVLIVVLVMLLLPLSASAMDFSAPSAPESAEKYMPEENASFAQGLWQILKAAIAQIQPNIVEAAKICMSLIAITLLASLLQNFSAAAKNAVTLAMILTMSILLIKPSNVMLQLGTKTVEELSEYGKLLLPVMTAAMAAQGGATASAALYTGTTVFNTVLSSGISGIMVPMIHIFTVICIANHAIGEPVLGKISKFLKWIMTWFLKLTIYIFTGYIGITGVVSGTADAAAVKATKLAMSGFVPVVGSIISDASETVLVSAGIMKNSVGIYGLFAMLCICIGPFLEIGVHYLMLKATAAICNIWGSKKTVDLIGDFSATMGILLAMTGTTCLLLMISIVCFMKGIA